MSKVKAIVLTGFGINCEEEMAAAYHLAGAEVAIVHLAEVFQEGVSLLDFDIINFPGGFSFGDNLGAGRVMANRLKYKRLISGGVFFDQILLCLREGKYVLGVCNGFQMLVTMGLLPGLDPNYQQHVALAQNDCGHFIDKWCHCNINSGTPCEWLEEGGCIDLPIRHAEGRLLVENEAIKQGILDKKLIVLQYSDPAGKLSKSANPNGSWMNCAGLTNPTGQVLGMMPHPEAYLSGYNHPKWGRMKRDGTLIAEGQGLSFFKQIVKAAINHQPLTPV